MSKNLFVGGGRRSRPPHAFTLVELLACVAIVGVLAALIGAGFTKTVDRSKNLQCTSMMRAIGIGIQQYASDNNGEFPRSSHNAWSMGRPQWSTAIFPYLENGETPSEGAFNLAFHCPSQKGKSETVRSYALNVFFQLGSGDLYAGSPSTWYTTVAVPRPARTILIAENRTSADHFMSHQWTTAKGAATAVDSLRHGKTSNYLFVDGHVESLPIGETFDTLKGINLWNPSLAK
jgi:prepilin-type processing-associated H-X9-DG protein/prepilin-type N-terminal cleavage/methylation domain-containing protein